jgi:RNA polymerase sigma-70 factor (ECF subfamily)
VSASTSSNPRANAVAENLLSQELNEMTTNWLQLFQAHQGPADQMSETRQRLVHRYKGPVYRFLLRVLHDPDLAADLTNEFALRLLRGDFRRADPDRGRFRDFLKTALYHLVADAHRLRARHRSLHDGVPEPASPDADPAAGTFSAFLSSWRDDLVAQAWAALGRLERRTGQPFTLVLRLRADHPELRSPELAQRLATRLGRPVTADAFRKTLQRARAAYADLLLAEVARSLETPTREQLEQELADLNLLEYCRPALERQGAAT